MAACLHLHIALSFSCQESVVLVALSLADFVWAMVINKPFHCLKTSAYSHDHLIILSFNKDALLPICINAFRFSYEEKACFTVSLIVVNIVCQLFVYSVIFNRQIMEVYPLEIIHVLVYSLQLCFTFFNLKQKLLLLFNHSLKLVLAFFIASFDNMELILHILASQIVLANLIFQKVDL